MFFFCSGTPPRVPPHTEPSRLPSLPWAVSMFPSFCIFGDPDSFEESCLGILWNVSLLGFGSCFPHDYTGAKGFEKKTTEVKYHFLHILSRVHTIIFNTVHYCWCWPWSPGWGSEYLWGFFSLSIWYALKGSHCVQPILEKCRIEVYLLERGVMYLKYLEFFHTADFFTLLFLKLIQSFNYISMD